MEHMKIAELEARITELEFELKTAQDLGGLAERMNTRHVKELDQKTEKAIELAMEVEIHKETEKKIWAMVTEFMDKAGYDRANVGRWMSADGDCSVIGLLKQVLSEELKTNEKLNEVTKQKDSLEHVIINTTGWGDFIQELDDDMIQILRDGGHPENDLLRDQDLAPTP